MKGPRDGVPQLHHRRPLDWRRSSPSPRAGSCSRTRRPGCSTSRTARSACSARSRTGSCASTGAGRHRSRSRSCCSCSDRCSARCSEVVIFRGLQQTTETIKLVVTVSLLFSMIGIANWIWDPDESRTTRRSSSARELLDRRRTGHPSRADHDHRRDPRRDRVALPAVPHPRRHRDAGRGRRPAAGRAARSPARPLVDARVGDRMLARRAERDPLRRHDRRSPPHRCRC